MGTARNAVTRFKRHCRDRPDAHCAHCGSVERLTLDHIVPIIRGGRPSGRSNFQILCWTCNEKKGDGLDPIKGVPNNALRDGLRKPLAPQIKGQAVRGHPRGTPLVALEPLELGAILHRLSSIGGRGKKWASELSRAKAIATVANELSRRGISLCP